MAGVDTNEWVVSRKARSEHYLPLGLHWLSSIIAKTTHHQNFDSNCLYFQENKPHKNCVSSVSLPPSLFTIGWQQVSKSSSNHFDASSFISVVLKITFYRRPRRIVAKSSSQFTLYYKEVAKKKRKKVLIDSYVIFSPLGANSHFASDGVKSHFKFLPFSSSPFRKTRSPQADSELFSRVTPQFLILCLPGHFLPRKNCIVLHVACLLLF